jgi:hypothetical protein
MNYGPRSYYSQAPAAVAEVKPACPPDMKFRITSPEQSAAIQEKLFSLGYAWAGVYSEQYVRFTDKPYLYFNRGMIQCSGSGEALFDAEPHQECVLVDNEFLHVFKAGSGT